MRTKSFVTTLALSWALAFAILPNARAATPDTISLGSGVSLVFTVAQVKGFYAKHNIVVTIPPTSSADEVRDALVSGKIQLAGFGADNAMAMDVKNAKNVVLIMDIEDPPIQLIGNKGITSVDQLRGKTLLVDSPVTQNAVIMKRILAKQGLQAGKDYQMKAVGGQPLRLAALKKDASLGGTMVSWPDFFKMKAAGYPVLGSSADVVGPMTFQVIYGKRAWVASHRALVERFLTAQLEAQRWMMDPKNKDDVIALYAKSRGYTPAVAAAAYAGLMSPTGWAKDGIIVPSELASVMKLRAQVEGAWGGNPPPPETFIDTSYLNSAINGLDNK